MSGLQTEIAALDTLLFGDNLYPCRGRGFSAGDVVLIRGEPGCGKTTLALQVVSNILRKNPDSSALFVTVEESVDAIQHKQEAYGFFSERLLFFDRDLVHDCIQPRRSEQSPHGRFLTSAVVRMLREAGIEVSRQDMSIAAAGASSSVIEEAISYFLQRCREALASSVQSHHTLLVLDSLSAFMNLLIDTFPRTQPRLLFNRFCHKLRKELGVDGRKPVIILTGEHHFHTLETVRELPESFFCDVEIVLRTEPVRASRQNDPAERVALGYDRAALVQPDAASLETRSFCRVLKSRRSPNQSRRCAYDIESGSGIRFFETYPGDGTLLVFAENEKQREVWRSFQDRDIPDAYPALRYDSFTLKGIQSVYDSTRRLHHVPLKTDMLLGTLDSYWVVGYRDYRFKKLINERLLRLIDDNIDPDTSLPRVDRSVLALKSQQTSNDARMARAEYPRFVNDLLYLALLRLEKTLYFKTYKHLKLRQSEPERRKRLCSDLLSLRSKISAAQAEIRGRYEPLCRFLFRKDCNSVLHRILNQQSQRLHLYNTFLRPLPRSRVALYGQYNGSLLETLRREDMHEVVDGEDYWLAIPYDANVGVFVARLDTVERTLEQLRQEEPVKKFCDIHQQLKQRELSCLEEIAKRVASGKIADLVGERDLDALRASLATATAECELQLHAARASLDALKPGVFEPGAKKYRLTWDQILCLSAVANAGLGIETRAFDTLMASFLEMLWNCGGRFRVDARYRIHDLPSQIVPLLTALHYFSAIFEVLPTPRSQSLDPADYNGAPSEAYGNWLFGRYWYSTLVDALTARHTEGSARNQFIWTTNASERQRIEIIRMPTGSSSKSATHYTCWGEWNLALLAGSENVTLACDLVSNLMGALKVTERGLRGAALPTVGRFYSMYKQERCVPMDIREDLELPHMTFGELREVYLEPTGGLGMSSDESGAIFRQSIFDYRHCGRAIHAGLLAIKNQPTSGRLAEDSVQRIVDCAIQMIRRMQALRNRYLFIGDSFSYDTLESGESAARRAGAP